MQNTDHTLKAQEAKMIARAIHKNLIDGYRETAKFWYEVAKQNGYGDTMLVEAIREIQLENSWIEMGKNSKNFWAN